MACLERRLKSWQAGNINDLVLEGRTIQQCLPKRGSDHNVNQYLAQPFSKLMLEGKTTAALRLLTDQNNGGLLKLNNIIPSSNQESLTVHEILESKHPQGHPAQLDTIPSTKNVPPAIHLVVFESIDAAVIRSSALRADGAVGPSGIDARGWRRLYTSFQTASNDLCHSLALPAKRLCTVSVDPQGFSPLLACRLVALDKNPGICPIGICEVANSSFQKQLSRSFEKIYSKLQDPFNSVPVR